MLQSMTLMVDRVREACAWVACRARHVRIQTDRIEPYELSLPPEPRRTAPLQSLAGDRRESTSTFWLTLDAINFGSGWFPTLRKAPGRSGYDTIAGGLERRFATDGPWSATELTSITPGEVAETVGQDPAHELMGLFAASLRDLGQRVAQEYGGRFSGVADGTGGSAAAITDILAGWECFADTSTYAGRSVPFLKRAQIAAADLARAGVISAPDLARLTMFPDNLVPHVLRLDGILRFSPKLVHRIERGELIEHGSAEEVEIRACAVHAVELVAAARPGACAAQIDQLLWNRGREPRYKSEPRHRSRCTAY